MFALLGRDHLQREPIERARCPGDQSGRDLGVAGRGLQMGVTEHDLDDPDVGAALQQVGGKAMPKRVGCNTLADPGYPSGVGRRRLRLADINASGAWGRVCGF